MNPKTLDPKLLEYCNTDRQREIVRLVMESGSISAAARALRGNQGYVCRLIRDIEKRAAAAGFMPKLGIDAPMPPDMPIRGMTVQWSPGKGVERAWLKPAGDADKHAALAAFAEGLTDTLRPIPQPKRRKDACKKTLLNLYTITDFHIGMLSWGEETGADWDTDIAESLILRWFRQAIDSSPPAERCVFAQLGDFIHFDGYEALTPTSRHILDADTRFQKLARVAARVIVAITEMLLEKYRHVHVLMADANHDPAFSAHARAWLPIVFRNCSRVVVDNSPDTYYKIRHGKTLLMFHHGHKRGPRDLGPVLVAKFAQDYGETEHRYAHLGHLHHDVVLETPLMRLEQHRTLAAQDAYASRSGFISKRDAKVITYHSEHGEVSRVTLSPEAVR